MGLYARHLRPRLLNAVMDTAGSREIRRRVCAGLAGEVLEIGYGSGLNQLHLPPEVRRVTAVEPSELALRLAGRRRAGSPVPVLIGGQDAQRMSFADAQFDGALTTWTLCAMADPAAALREIRRVLRPGAALHFVEHGLAPDASVARWQRRGNPVNCRIAGCLLDRDVRALLAGSGLTVTALRTYYDADSPRPAGYFYEGRAVA